MKINKLTYITFLISMMLLLNTTVASEINSNSETNQNPALFPQVVIKSLEIVTQEPEQDLTIHALASIENNDSLVYENLLLQITASEQSFERDPLAEEEDPIIVNETISMTANSTSVFDIDFLLDAGTYVLTSAILINGVMIPTSVNVTSVNVIGPPIGDTYELASYVAIILSGAIIVVLFPAFIDKFRRAKHLNGNNGNNIK